MSENYTTSLVVDQTPAEVFAAVNNPRGWWSEEIDGDTATLAAEFDYHYGDMHRTKLRVAELVPGEQVSWLVLDNYFKFTDDETEWTGTTISFAISQRDGKTALDFTHVGLVPEYECYDVCRKSWNFYVDVSLRNLITTGTGRPNRKPKRRTRTSKSTSD